MAGAGHLNPILPEPTMAKMRATVFRGPNDIRVEEVERPRPARARPSCGSP